MNQKGHNQDGSRYYFKIQSVERYNMEVIMKNILIAAGIVLSVIAAVIVFLIKKQSDEAGPDDKRYY